MITTDITLHACKRFAERAMGLEADIQLTRQQSDLIAERLILLLNEAHPSHEMLSVGCFTINDQGITIIKEDGRVITVKTSSKVLPPAFRGGARAQIKNKRKDLPRTK